MKRLLAVSVSAYLMAATLATPRAAAQRGAADLPPPSERSFDPFCGTTQDRARQLGIRPRAAVATGQGVSFTQDPPVLSSDFTESVRFQDFMVSGDVPSARFKLSGDGNEIETWTRTATRDVGGQLVSIFNPSWSYAALDRVLRGQRWGWDLPAIYWGEFLPPNAEPGNGYGIWLRIAPTTLPHATVFRIGDDIQYSSHVVNLVIRGFGDGYLSDEYGFELARVSTKFYEHFHDAYEGIAVVPEQIFLPPYGAFHRNVQNAVRGIGLGEFDFSATYGSQAHRLRSIELYNGHRVGRHDVSSHEIGHQWASYIDWSRLTGLVRAGVQPQSHDPLWTEGESLVDAVLSSYRRIRRGATGWEIERTPAPIRFHPFSLYAMGILSRNEVPEVTLFDDQTQFLGELTPDPGRGVTGSTRTATIFNVIGMLGERSGPIDSEWNRATIVVSRDKLLSQQEMNYWTFLVQRLEDPNGTGVIGYDGAGSFELSTNRRIDLKTDIRPLTAAAIPGRLGPDYPDFGRQDWREVVFDNDVPSHYRAGERIRWSGRINARDRSDVDEILIRLWKSGGTSNDAIRVYAPVSSGGSSFIAETSTSTAQRGIYVMEVFLFWPGAGTQASRVSISPISLE